MDRSKAAITRDRIAVGVAVATVLLLVGLQLYRNGETGRSGEAARGRDIEQLIGSGRWVAGLEKTQAFLSRHPLERRAYLYLSQCQLAREVPHAALQHLVLATTPLPPGSQAQFLAVPSKEETAALLAPLEEGYPNAMEQGAALLRRARLAAVWSDWPAFERNLRAAAAVARPVSGRSFGAVGNAFLASVLMAPLARVDELHLPPDSVDALVGLAGAEYGTIPLAPRTGPGAPSFVAALAGGSFTGGQFVLWVAGEALRYPSAGGWLFVAVNPDTGEPVAELRHELGPLTNESASVQSWQAALPEDALVVGLAAGEAVMSMSQEARNVLRDLWGLTGIPGASSLSSMAFVVRLQPSAPVRVVEVTSAAPDLPAMLFLKGDGQE
jgi:hypothetical protein